MIATIFNGLFDTAATATIPVGKFLLCVGAALVIGAGMALAYCYRSRFSKTFVTTLALLPAVVCVVIMLVNGNIGAGVAVAGTFSLVRFRSVPGTAKEIGAIFLAMAVGLIAGMGYLAYAALFAVILCAVNILLTVSGFGEHKAPETDRTLRITIPEDLDYTGVFDEPMKQYTNRYDLVHVKTTNMGSLYKLTYNLTLKSTDCEKEFIDALRCRNGNLEISSSRQENTVNEL